MVERTGSTRVAPVTRANTDDHFNEQLDNKVLKRKIIKQHILESKRENQEVEEKYFKEIVAKEFFSKEVEGSILQETYEAIPDSYLGLYESSIIEEAKLASDPLKVVNLTSEELSTFFEFIDGSGKKRAQFDELAENLMTAGEGQEEGLIDQGARVICSNNKSEIYLMLCYLLENLVRKKAKEKLQERLKKIIDSFQRQESAFLFSYFSFQNMVKEADNSAINSNLLDKMANISAGNIKLNSLRQSLQFVAQSLPDKDMYKMVSIFMKFQAQGLKKISTLSEGREGKEELANILQQERNLIILNSLYNQCRKVFSQLKKVTPIDEKYSEFMMQVITVIESSVVSLDGLQNMERFLGITKITLEINRVFIKGFKNMLSKMPQPIFYNESMREKLLENMNNIINKIETLLEPKSSGLSFLREKREVQSRVRSVTTPQARNDTKAGG